MAREHLVERKVLRSFLGEGANETYRKGQVVSLDEQRAMQYDAQKLTEPVKSRPSKAAAQASAEDSKKQRAAAEAKKATGAAENKSVAPSATKAK